MRYLNRAKVKKHLKTRGKRGVFRGLPWLRSSVAVGASLGLFGECWRASVLIVRHPCKFGLLGYPCAIAFPHSFQISVLRAFLGGLFGFIGFRCIFDWLVAFVGLVGLYACIVRRLEVRKRKRPYFCGLLRPYFCGLQLFAFACLVFVASLVLFALLLLFVGCVVGGSFSLWTI